MPTNNRDISEVKFLTVAEVAAVMRVSKMTVYRLVHNGELPAVRVGRSFRVSEDDVNEYLRSSFFDAGWTAVRCRPARHSTDAHCVRAPAPIRLAPLRAVRLCPSDGDAHVGPPGTYG